MNHSAVVKQFLKDRTTANGLEKGFPFVTISRQAGAGGHTLARQIIRSLEKKFTMDAANEWEVFDQKLCALLTESGVTKATFDSLITEEYQSEVRQFVNDLISGQPTQYKLFKRIFEVVRLLGSVGKVVIVGRAGAFVTRDLPHGIHIRLVAGEDVRVARMAKMLEVSEDKARKAVRTQDRARARLVNDYFNCDNSDPVHYHAVFNSERISIPDVADIVADLVGEQIKAMKKRK